MVDAGYRTIKVKVGVDRGTAPLRDLARIGKVREAVGPQVGIMLDANNCWRVATAARFANVVKDLDVLFLEEPVPADDLPGLARFRAATDLPLATGEHEYTKFGVRDLLVNGAVDVLQVDAARTGGFTEMVKIVGMAQAWNVAVAPHGMDFLHLQLAGAYADVPYAERLLMFDELTTRTFVNAPAQVDGFLGVPDSPGLGLVLDMDYVTHNEREA
jgi:L-rhamnonate dehydratase